MLVLTLTIQTNDSNSKFVKNYQKPTIYAYQLNVIIESLNKSVDRTYFICTLLTFKTIASKNKEKKLFLIYTDRYITSNRNYLKLNSINDSTIYVDCLSIELENEIKESMTIISSPSFYRYDYQSSDFRYIEGSLLIYAPSDLNTTYIENAILVEYPDHKTVTIQEEFHVSTIEIDLKERTIIRCKEGLTENDIILPNLRFYNNDKDSLPQIVGDWLYGQHRSSGFLLSGEGFQYNNHLSPQIKGEFFYAANLFPIYKFNYGLTLILTEKKFFD